MQIAKKYDNILTQLYQQCITKTQGTKLKKQHITQTYQKSTIPKITTANSRLTLILDNTLAQQILHRIKTSQTRYSTDFKKLQSHLNFLEFLTQHLAEIGFITSRYRRRIEAEVRRIEGGLEYRLGNRMVVLEKSEDVGDFREEFFGVVGQGIGVGGDQGIDVEDQEEVRRRYVEVYQKFFEGLDRKLFIKIDSLISHFQKKQLLLPPQLLTRIDTHLGPQTGRNDFQLQANRTLIHTAQSQSLQSNQQYLQLLEQQYQQLKKLLGKFSGMRLFSESLKLELYLSKFGSIISGFATRNTDMDLTVLVGCYVNQVLFLEYLESFVRAEYKERKNVLEVKLVKARIPVLKLKFLSKNDEIIQIDVIVNNILGIVNSKFLSVYAQIPWIKQLGILIKVWAKNKGIVKEQYFSSYSLNLMLIHFLYQTGRVNLIMDARQRNQQKTPHFVYKRVSKGLQQKFNVYFQFKTQKQHVTALKRVNLYQILLQFFHYFSDKGKHWNLPPQDSIITVDGLKQKKVDQEYLFMIKDPFDEMHNPGRVKAVNRVMMVQAFTKAYEGLKEKNIETLKSLFY